jgi:ubiquinone/menaquinone biosynthesis C-methylase UbiE
MKKTTQRRHNTVGDALRLQRGLYTSRNPTRRWLHNSRLQWLISAIRRHFPEKNPGPGLDLGTGCGILLPALSRQFKTTISVDIESEFLCHIKAGMPPEEDIHYLAGDARALPVRDNIAELIVCAEVLEHIDNDLACLEEIYRALKPGGLLMLSTPQPLSLLELTAGVILNRPMIPLARKIYREPVLPTGHINLMSARKLSDKLIQTGFTIIETHKSGLYLPGLAEIPAQAPQKIAAALNTRLSGTIFDFLLWTQFFVARKQTP